MRRTKIAVIRAELSPLRNERAIGSELHDAARFTFPPALLDGGDTCHLLPIVSVRYENAAVRRNNDVVRPIEMGAVVARLTGDAETHQQLAVRAELVHLLTFRAARVGDKVRDPDVTVTIHIDTVRNDEDARAEISQYFACVAIELEDRIDGIRVAVNVAGGRTGSTAASAAPLIGPDMPVGGIDFDACRVPPGSPGR